MKRLRPALLLALALLCGCDSSWVMNLMTPKEDERVARGYLALMRSHDLERIEKDLDPALQNDNVRETLARMVPQMPAQQPLSSKIVGAHTWRGQDVYVSNISFELHYPDLWMLANVAVQKKHGQSTIVGLNIVPMSDSLENLTRFSLAGKSGAQYAILALAVAAAVLTLAALVRALRTPGLERRWLWIIFILVGFGKLAVDWSTGVVSLKLPALQLFSASALAPLYGSWTVAASLPLGALVFLLRRRGVPARAPATSP